MNARPHPSPLPQERENRTPRFGEVDALGGRVVSSAKKQIAATTTVAVEFSEDAQSRSLCPGERVRVRASVQLTV
jgi:hypothetical protein